MARWRLTAPHYLNCPGTEWEMTETDTGTGRQVRHRHQVPRYIDPKDPNDQNRDGDVVVCHEGTGQPRDIVFVGPPTPEMEPLDDEAKSISDSLRSKWNFYGTEGYGEAVLADFQKQLASAQTSTSREMDELKAQVAELAKQNAELLKKLPRRV